MIKKITTYILLFLFSFAFVTLLACDDKTTISVLPIRGIDGYSDAVINSTEKSISFITASDVESVNASIINVGGGVTYEVYSDSNLSTQVSVLTLAVGDNTFYVRFSVGKTTDTWSIKIRKLAPVVKTVVSIEIKTFEKEYVLGEVFKGGTIKVNYEGSSMDLSVTNAMLSGFDTSSAGKKTVTITYEGKTVQVEITVSKAPASVSSIKVKSANSEYLVDSEFVSGKITVEYDDIQRKK